MSQPIGFGPPIVNGIPLLPYSNATKVGGPFALWNDDATALLKPDGSTVSIGGAVAYVTDVMAYGATGDGTTDDGVAVQDAIDAVSEAGGGTLYFPPGVYAIGATVKVPSGVRLLGSGSGRSVLYALASLPTTSPMLKNESGDTGFDVFADSDIVLQDLTFDGGGRTFNAWDQGTNPPTYGGLSAGASRGHLVRMYSVERFRSVNCEYRNHRSNAALVCAGGKDQLIAGNWFHDNGKIDDVSPCLFVSPSFPNSTPNYNCVVTGNVFEHCDRMAARFEVQGGTFAHNMCRDLGEGGIHIENGGICTVTGNVFRDLRVTDIVGNGIEIESDDEDNDGMIAITGNVFENIGTRGVALNGSQSVTVTGNVFRNCGQASVYPTPNGPLNYAAGRSAGDPMEAHKRCALNVHTADTYQSRHVIVANNVIVETGTAMQYGIAFTVTGTPAMQFEYVEVRDNIIQGAAVAEYYDPTTVSVGDGVFIPKSSVAQKVRSTAASPTLDNGDATVLVNASGGNKTITLPLAASYGAGYTARVHIYRIDASGNTVTIQRQSTDTLNGGTSETLAAGTGKTYIGDGVSAWYSF